MFLTHISAKTEADKSRLPLPNDFSKALYVFDIGQNDISAGLRKLGDEKLRQEIPDIVNQLVLAVEVSCIYIFFICFYEQFLSA